jgi:hypothetical protein
MTKPASHDTHTFVFNKATGPALLALADARDAIRRFPEQWSYDVWGDQPKDRGQFTWIPSDWNELPEEVRRGFATQIWRDMADRPLNEVDSALAGRYATRFNAAAVLNVSLR